MKAASEGTARLVGAPDSLVPWNLPCPDRFAGEAYQQAIAAIWAFSETPRSLDDRFLAQTRKLDRMRVLLDLLGTPQTHFRTILVAGTKGKGSMAAMLASILDSAGYRVGRYTQPHLYSYRERIWAHGRYAPEAQVVEELAAMQPALSLVQRHAAELGSLTTFDVGTALALLHFAHSAVEIAVVEVGVGGANDDTNVLEPVAAAIGPIGLDHLDVLGGTLEEVARQKAGVMRAGIDVVVGRQDPPAPDVLAAEAAARSASLQVLGVDLDWWAEDCCDGPFNFRGPAGALCDLEMPLIGHFQRENAALAIGVAQSLSRHGLAVEPAAIRAGLAAVQWPGRFQVVAQCPLTIVDGAHNPTAAKALATTARHYLRGRPVTLVLGMSDTKDAPATLAELAGIADRVVITRSSHPRACEPARLAAAARALALPTFVEASPGDALASAWRVAGRDGAVLVTGSLFLVGDVLEWLWSRAAAVNGRV